MKFVKKLLKKKSGNSDIKELRLELGMTQQQFADEVGFKRNTVALWELGKGNPSERAKVAIKRLQMRKKQKNEDLKPDW